MKTTRFALATLLIASMKAAAAVYTLDPDHYASGTDLTHALPQLTLSTAISSDNQTVMPS